MRNPSYDAYLLFMTFWATVGGENLRGYQAQTEASKPNQKVGQLGGTFRPTTIISRNHYLEIFRGEPLYKVFAFTIKSLFSKHNNSAWKQCFITRLF